MQGLRKVVAWSLHGEFCMVFVSGPLRGLLLAMGLRGGIDVAALARAGRRSEARPAATFRHHIEPRRPVSSIIIMSPKKKTSAEPKTSEVAPTTQAVQASSPSGVPEEAKKCAGTAPSPAQAPQSLSPAGGVVLGEPPVADAASLGGLGGGSRVAPSAASPEPPVIPERREATKMNEEQTEAFMRQSVAYNLHGLRKVIAQGGEYFDGWPDRPLNQQPPLDIKEPGTDRELLSFMSAWQRDQAMVALRGTSSYQAAGNVFWINPFTDKGQKDLVHIAGDPPLMSSVMDAAHAFSLDQVALDDVAQGKAVAAKSARVKFPHTLLVYQFSGDGFDADSFDSLPLVTGHVSLWGFHLALTRALTGGNVCEVAVLAQAALCAPMEGYVASGIDELAVKSMAVSELFRATSETTKQTFPAFARKFNVALSDVGPRQNKKEVQHYIQSHNICFNGSPVQGTMLQALYNCHDRLDEKGHALLRQIERRSQGKTSDFCKGFTALNRLLQTCHKEFDCKKGSLTSVLWGETIKIHDLVNHVLAYVSWSLEGDRIPPSGVTSAWFSAREDAGGRKKHSGATKTTLAKINLKMYVEGLVQDLPADSKGKAAFLTVLAPFQDYEVFGKTFAESRDTPTPAPDQWEEDGEGEDGKNKQQTAPTEGQGEQPQKTTEEEKKGEEEKTKIDPFTAMQKSTPPYAVHLLNFLFDLFSDSLDDVLQKFLTNDSNVATPVGKIRWEDWAQDEFKQIRRQLNLHRRTVPPDTDEAPPPAQSTRTLKRSLSQAEDDDEDNQDDASLRREVQKERREAWSGVVAKRRRVATCTYLETADSRKAALDKWWGAASVAKGFRGKPGSEHRVFIMSAEKLEPETGQTPWVGEPQVTPVMMEVVDWMLERKGPCDTVVVFDGRSTSVRRMLDSKMNQEPNATEAWIIFKPRREPGVPQTLFGSRNRESAFVSLPLSKNGIAVDDRAEDMQSDYEHNDFAATFSGVNPLVWAKLPSMDLPTKEKIQGGQPPVPPSQVYNTDNGCPLCWGEKKPKELLMSILRSAKASSVVDLSPGGGVTARACLALGIPWVGLCWNQMHANWLGRVLDHWALEQIAKDGSKMYDADLAELLKKHFDDTLTQVEERDQEEQDDDFGDDMSVEALC